MSDQSPGGGFNRPWEDSDEEAAEVVPLPGVIDDEDEATGDAIESFTLEEAIDRVPEPEAEHPGHGESDDDPLIDWEAMAESKSGIEEYTSEEYLAATTQEYQGLAEEVSRASEEEWEQQAVSAALPGVDSGLVGFEDVSGTAQASEESYEAHEKAVSSDLALRVASGVVIFGLFLGSLLLGGWWFTAFIILVMMVAVGEFYATTRSAGHKPLALFGLIGVALAGFGAHVSGVPAIAGWVALTTLVILLFVSLTPRGNPLGDASVTVLGLAWVAILAFAVPFGFAPNPVAKVLFVVLLIAFNDIGAFFVGRAFGKNPLAPNLSPNKTIEGVVGGLVVGAVVASILASFPPWESIGLARALVLAAIVGVFTPLGDIVESMVKRSIDVKDMGSVLPGHGGMLDRIDGFLFAVPAIYFAFLAYGLL